jgi:ATP synthase protein I
MTTRENNNPLQNYARYTSIGIQMLVIIVLGVFGGYKLDQYLGTTPLLTIILSFAGVTLAIYHAIKDFLRSTKKDPEKNPKRNT